MTGIHAHLGPACDKCWRDGHRDGWAEGRDFEAHKRGCGLLLLAAIVGILAFVIGFVIAGSVFAASRSAPTTAHLEAPPRLVFHVTTGQGGASPPPAPPEPTDLDDGGGISSALVAGTASWYDVGPGLYGAVPSYRWGDPRYKVRVCRLDKPSRCVTVTILDFCGCPGSRVIDLSRQAFARLESPSRGLVAVTVESGGDGPDATLPATDVP